MLNWLIRTSLKNRLLVCVLAAALIIIGARSLVLLPIDAFPDTTPVQVQINTTAASLNPQETEAQITIPVELAIGGLPGLQNVRSISKFGLSQVVATFDDSVSIFKARQLITERLQSVELPEGLERPQLGPIATGLGEARNMLVVRASDALIAVGGEFGTLSEIAFALKIGKPVVGLRTWELAKSGRPAGAIRRAASPAKNPARASPPENFFAKR
jgi:cobalt-zinc-cadmium resistance protein CzcA